MELAADASRAPALRRAWGVVERAGELAIVLLTLAMVAACLAQVVWRYAFADPLTWSEEAARYLLVWLSFLCAWLAWRQRAHLGLDVLVARLPAPAQRGAGLLAEALVAAFAALSIVAGQTMVEVAMMQPSAVLELPMGWVYAAWPAAAALILGDVLVGWATGRRAVAAGADWI